MTIRETNYQARAEYKVDQRLQRERQYFDELVEATPATRGMLDRFSEAFYEKGDRGRLWSPFWGTTDLKGRLVLDYGCGKGDFSRILAKRGACVRGIDISPKLIEEARSSAARMEFNGNAPKFLVGDAHHTPFPDALFDNVVGNGALHHLDLKRALPEIARVLKPGGKAVFQETMSSHPLLWALRRLTPKAHTTDERPLSWTDINLAPKEFTACRHRQHFLLAVCAAPAHLLGKRFALSVIGALDRMDQQLMRLFPYLRRYAWLTVLEFEK